MKLTVLLFALAITISAMAQISKADPPGFFRIGKAQSGLVFIASVSYAVANSDTTYRLSYTDVGRSFAGTESVDFINTDGAVDQLYNMIKGAFASDRGSEVKIKLGDTFITIRTVRVIGSKTVQVRVADRGYFELENKRQAEKLFGKK